MIELNNADLKVQINPDGAELSSVKEQSENLEYMWQADPKFWGRHAPVLFPIVGRLKDDHYTVAGQSYKMTQHGFARDQTFKVVSHDATSAIFELVADDVTKAMYPFDFKLQLRYTLEGHMLTVTYHVENPDAEAMLPFSIGGHPAFNVPLGANEGGFEDYQITVAPKKTYPQIPLVGPYNDAQHEKELNLTTPLQLDHDLFDQDALILDLNQVETTVMLSSTLNDHGVALTLAQAPYVGIWSPYPKQAPFVCIEPWWGIADNLTADGELTHKQAIQQLAPNTQFEAAYQLRFF
ncbi:aldose 1-epimerase family protein [Secundilactobacillus kimchicus]|uniref:Aldose epimerase n=1 Tax=Secundilactobacillus kimchicus JCM 15530 TaxID=1302272 RepID=A0A0R1I0T6_9LACO|nr:aldose 1-epimerase family protein [Secundilactobacillus kimchicus]KRK49354.1 aldose epimerase [Secundilactobacillus kimchicus JCM 15530]